jgi:hypothetical protein
MSGLEGTLELNTKLCPYPYYPGPLADHEPNLLSYWTSGWAPNALFLGIFSL